MAVPEALGKNDSFLSAVATAAPDHVSIFALLRRGRHSEAAHPDAYVNMGPWGPAFSALIRFLFKRRDHDFLHRSILSKGVRFRKLREIRKKLVKYIENHLFLWYPFIVVSA